MQMMQRSEFEVTSNHVLDLAARSNCSANECEFVALAEDLDIPLVTSDQQLLSQFPGRAISLDSFTSP